jgi:hypothetical protein
MGQRGRPEALANAGHGADERRGLLTSGVAELRDGHRVALFFSGRRHAGEDLAEALKPRAAALPPPIQMGDALSRNLPGELQTILAHCLAHPRRQFVEVHERFPGPCRYLLEALAVVYRNDATARQRQLSPEARLRWHQEASGPTLRQLHDWLTRRGAAQRPARPRAVPLPAGGTLGKLLQGPRLPPSTQRSPWWHTPPTGRSWAP